MATPGMGARAWAFKELISYKRIMIPSCGARKWKRLVNRSDGGVGAGYGLESLHGIHERTVLFSSQMLSTKRKFSLTLDFPLYLYMSWTVTAQALQDAKSLPNAIKIMLMGRERSRVGTSPKPCCPPKSNARI